MDRLVTAVRDVSTYHPRTYLLYRVYLLVRYVLEFVCWKTVSYPPSPQARRAQYLPMCRATIVSK